VSFDYPNPRSQVEIVGTHGWISLSGTGMRREPFTELVLHASEDEVFANGEQPHVERFEDADAYRLEVEHLSASIRTGEPLRYTLDDSVANTRVIDAVRDSAAHGRAVAITTQEKDN
jgi:predicted dehydrogenase